MYNRVHVKSLLRTLRRQAYDLRRMNLAKALIGANLWQRRIHSYERKVARSTHVAEQYQHPARRTIAEDR